MVQRDQWDTYRGPKNDSFLIRGRGRPTVYGGRTSGILSIPAQEVSLGSLGVGIDMVSHLPRMRPGSGHNRPILSARHQARGQVPQVLDPELSGEPQEPALAV